MKQPILKFGLILFAICFFSAGLLAGVNFLTRGKIALQKYREEQDALKEVMAGAVSFEAIKDGRETLYYKALDESRKIVGYCFVARGRGYSSTIETMAGMDTKGKISGIKILSQSETPGLGAKIAEPESETTLIEFLAGKAEKKQVRKPWFEVRFGGKDIDGLDKIETITGATISSSAVIKSVKEKAEEVIGLVK